MVKLSYLNIINTDFLFINPDFNFLNKDLVDCWRIWLYVP